MRHPRAAMPLGSLPGACGEAEVEWGERHELSLASRGVSSEEVAVRNETTRRGFLGESVLIGAAAAAIRADDGAAGETTGGRPQPHQMPTIKLGKLEVSRLILGSNPFFGFDHGNPQASADEMRKYYTEERIMAVMDAAADHGITAVWTPSYDHWIRLWNQYREKGGKLKIWIGQPDGYGHMRDHITACARNGGRAVCVQGECAGRAIRGGEYDLVRGWLEHIKSFGLPAGLASHRPEELLKAEEQGLPAEFYHLTVGIPDSYRQGDRDKALETIRKLDKPVVAFKTLGAGRFMPKDAFPYVLRRLRRKDGICVGVFPKKRDEIAENAALAARLTAEQRDA